MTGAWRGAIVRRTGALCDERHDVLQAHVTHGPRRRRLALATATTATAAPVGAAVRSVTTPDGHTFRLRMVARGLGLPAGGGTVHVSGGGYNADQGIVIALCAIPAGVTVGATST